MIKESVMLRGDITAEFTGLPPPPYIPSHPPTLIVLRIGSITHFLPRLPRVLLCVILWIC